MALYAVHQEVKASFDRCEATGDFAETFYELFLNSSPEIAPHFSQTNFVKQKKLLRGTVYILVTRDPKETEARKTLERIGRSHNRSELNIRPDLYELWLNSLCATVKRLDPHGTPELDALWRQAMRPAIEVITSLY